MEQEVIPVFVTHHSIGESILTIEKEKEIEPLKPVSVLAIAKQYEQKGIFVVDSDISSYWKLYKNAKELELHLVYGVKLAVCTDLTDKTPESQKTESSVIIVFKNSQAYYDFVPLYSQASTEGYHKERRLDWKTLKDKWSDNFALYLPFYSSFIARNNLCLDQKAFPDFSRFTPTFLVEEHGLPFDNIIHDGINRYVAATGYPTLKSHQVYYYRDVDAMKHLTIQCIERRSNWDKPNIEHYASNQFSYESYLRAIGKSL